MRKKVRRKTILIDGIRYYDDKPDTCRKCFFWKNRKVGCVLGTQNCYYLAEAVKTEQEMLWCFPLMHCGLRREVQAAAGCSSGYSPEATCRFLHTARSSPY